MDNATASALFDKALQLIQQGDPKTAKRHLLRIASAFPGNPQVHFLVGICHSALGDRAQAIAGYDRAIAIQPDFIDAYINRASDMHASGKPELAVSCLQRALAINPDNAILHLNLGSILYELKRYSAALASFEQAIARAPTLAEAHKGRADALCDLERREEALPVYRYALTLAPEYVEAMNNLTVALVDLELYEEALYTIERVIELSPNEAEGHYNRGNALRGLQRLGEAVESYERAIGLNPRHANAYNNRGIVLNDLGLRNEAIASFDQAIALDSRHVKAFFSKGAALLQAGSYNEAATAFLSVRELDPAYPFLDGATLFGNMCACNWDNYEAERASLLLRINNGKCASLPFPVLALTADASLQRKAAEIFTAEKCPPKPQLGRFSRRQDGSRIRIGYFSGDFHEHPVMHLMGHLFELHDKDRFELVGISFGPDKRDAIRQRVAAAFDRFIDVRNLPDIEVARLTRELGVDIAVDITGHTGFARTGIFAHRAAPIQVNYLGYPGTMGAAYFDYIIADRMLIPEEARAAYTEKVVYMPGSYQVNDARKSLAEKIFTREELGLPADGFVFCSFNNSYKFNPATFDSWMRILDRVDGSVLWMFASNPMMADRLSNEAQRRGIDPMRLIFAKRVPLLAEHLARYRAANLFLDTFPYNAHTTASDALLADLPVLTLMGESYASRVAASLLNTLGLQELTTTAREAYETLAIDLALHPSKLDGLRRKLQENKAGSSLFDTAHFARNLEAAYTAMFERHLANLPPEHIIV